MKTHRLLGYARRNLPLYIFCASMLILQVSIRVVAPTLLARIVDEVIGGGNYAIFPRLLFFMAISYFLPGLLGYFQEYTSDKISKRTSCFLRHDVFEAISLETCVNKRLTIGAPGKDAMIKVIEIEKDYLKNACKLF